MSTQRRVHLFRNGRNQALRIPREFELEGSEAIITKEGDKLIIQPVTKKNGLRELLSTWEPLDEPFPEIEDPHLNPEDIF